MASSNARSSMGMARNNSSGGGGQHRRSHSASNLVAAGQRQGQPAPGRPGGAGGRRQSSDIQGVNDDDVRSTVAKIGPKRKSRVGIASHHPHHHGGHGHHASTAHLHKKGGSRSHVSLANLVNEITTADDDNNDGDDHAEAQLQPAKRTIKNRDRVAGTTTTIHDGDADDADAGWVSAASSKTATPEMGTSPVERQVGDARGADAAAGAVPESPSSFKPLEFAKKPRRKIQRDTFPQNIPEAYADKRQSARTPLSNIPSESTTPTEARESVLSHAAPPSSTQQPDRHDRQANSKAETGAEPAQQDDMVTPTVERDQPLLAQVNFPTDQNKDPAQASKHPVLATSPTRFPPNTVLSPPTPSSADRPEKTAPVLPPATSRVRPTALRKTSTSTIRSLTGMSTRAPLSPAMRKGTGPLQPRLDLQESIAELPSFTTQEGAKGKERQHDSDPPAPSSTDGSRQRQTSANSTRTGTLTSEAAASIAKRLRTVSGGDLRDPAGHTASGQQRRGGLNRSASTASTSSLANILASPADERGGGVTGTLKRASGYFGSIGRLAGLAGFTSSSSSLNQDQEGGSGTSPTRILPGGKRSPGIAPGSSRGPAGSPNTFLSKGRGRQTILPQKQPLISKFIDPAESYVPFPRPRQRDTRGVPERGNESRARQKMMTQRDYPDSGDENVSSPVQQHGSASEEDLGGGGNRSSSSQLNLRSGASTPGRETKLAPSVQRWITALVKEAERIDKEHETCMRFNDTVKDSFERVLKKKKLLDSNSETSGKKEAEEPSSSRPSSLRRQTMR